MKNLEKIPGSDRTEYSSIIMKYKSDQGKEKFPDCTGNPGVKTLRFQCRGHGFDPWSGN